MKDLTQYSKPEIIKEMQDLENNPGWTIIEERILANLKSAEHKMFNSSRDDVDYHRGYYHCAKLISELRQRLIDENKEIPPVMA